MHFFGLFDMSWCMNMLVCVSTSSCSCVHVYETYVCMCAYVVILYVLMCEYL